MSIMYIVKRTQIYLDEEQDRRLAARARAHGVTKSDLIRQAIDVFLEEADSDARQLEEFKAAVQYFQEHPLELPDMDDSLTRSRAASLERQAELERRWHG